MRSLSRPALYDWEGDQAPRRPFSRTVIYEMHVGGFTGIRARGSRRTSAEPTASR